MDAEDDDKVVVQITKWAEGKRNPVGKVIEVLGKADDPDVDILAIMRKYQLSDVFPKKVMRQVRGIDQEIGPESLVGRRDLRDACVITIDGADSKDLDDAITIEKLANGNYRLGVHIADVSHYVPEGSRLDKEAIKRGTSVYLVDRVIPMLPKELSNGICSLHPDVDRLTMSCTMDIDDKGNVVHHELYPSVIRSKYRLTYGVVSDILEGVPDAEIDKYQSILPMLNDMQALCDILRARRDKRGAIDFDFKESTIVLDEDGVPTQIKPRERRIANRMIEEFMIIANETVAEHIYWLELPFVYRVHEEPSPDKIEDFNAFIHKFGHRLTATPDELRPKEVQRLLNKVAEAKEKPIVHKLMLRALKQARYAPECEGHFGLAAKYYCHFTSPIRRYPDLQIHRIIKAMLAGEIDGAYTEKLKQTVDIVSVASSESERIAERAERETDDIKKAQYMQGFIGERFEGMVAGVTSFGVFVELDNTVEGLALLSQMDDDYYHFDEQRLMVVGESTGNTYTIGDRVRVVVDSVDVTHGDIDFEIIEKLEA